METLVLETGATISEVGRVPGLSAPMRTVWNLEWLRWPAGFACADAATMVALMGASGAVPP